MGNIGAIVGPVISGASSLTSAVVETWVKPTLVEFAKSKKIDRLLFEHSIESKFSEYLNRAYQRQSYIRTLVFQDKPMLLEELYLPLTVKTRHDGAAIVIDGYKQELIPENRRVLLTDTAGMGKSTLLRYLFLSCIRENAGTPIFIELRHLSLDKTIVDIIHDDLCAVDSQIDKDFLMELLRQGNFVFFLDGYDEIPYASRDVITKQLQDFISKASNNDFILSSRPEEALATFADFNHFHIIPLSDEEAYELLVKYDRDEGIAEQIINKLKTPQYEDVHEFLTNPLLVSLLYKAYQYENNIPLKKHIFYRQVYDALFHSHDFTKIGAFVRPKHSNLDVEEFHSVLRSLGFITFKTGKIEYGRDELLSYITKAKDTVANVTFKDADLLLDLISTVPVFLKDGEYFRWNHKSIQEYFAAQYICRDAKSLQGNILRLIASDKIVSRYLNVLDLCYDIDYNSFRNTVVYDVAIAIDKYWKETYSQIDTNLISEYEVDRRRTACIETPLIIFPASFFDSMAGFEEEKNESIRHLQIVRTYLDEKDLATGDTGFGFGLRIFDDGASVCHLYRQERHQILSLLRLKRNAIFARSKTSEADIAQVWLHLRKQAISSVCEDGNPLFLDDNPQSLANSPSYFSRVNEWIFIPEPIIEITACRSLIEEVNRDTSDEVQADILAGLV